jgi:transcriptional regulator with XRE-family HTH domain
MAEQKIFSGPRIRRIRNQKGLTQTAMAQQLGISPSYLNLIERNQRPLTVQLILKLAFSPTRCSRANFRANRNWSRSPRPRRMRRRA